MSVALADGDWSLFSTFAGVLLGVMVLAFHRRAPHNRTIRSGLIRLAFGLSVALCLYLVVAWPLDVLFERTGVQSSPFSEIGLVLLGVLIAVFEPRFVSWLDTERAVGLRHDRD